MFTTRPGAVRGRPARWVPLVTAVLGIPYAAPPFGPRRFRGPRPVAEWTGVRPCLTFGPVAPQSAELAAGGPPRNGSRTQEGCARSGARRGCRS
ncbi:carboxylesterase family protein [Streptomyces sp. NBC_01335]|nr:carboxylesterase family protein [Streptomyces sp. NBC_01335]